LERNKNYKVFGGTTIILIEIKIRHLMILKAVSLMIMALSLLI
jgi:hypothetical protein